MRYLHFLLFASILAQEVILIPRNSYPTATLGDVYSFRIVEPYPSVGELLYNAIRLESPYVFEAMTLLTYRPYETTIFQTLDYDSNAILYDSFNVEYTLVDGETETTTVANFSVGVSIIDAPINTTPDIVIWVNGSTPTQFDIPVGTQKDTYGTYDGLVSRYAFKRPDTGQVYVGLRFTNTDRLFHTDCSSPLDVNSSYLTTSFCAVSNGSSFVQRFPYIIAGRTIYSASSGFITLASFGVTRICDVCNVSIAEGLQTSTDITNVSHIVHPDGIARFSLVIDVFPEGIDLLLGNVPITSTITDMGEIPQHLSILPRPSFFTEYRYFDQNGPSSTNYSDGTSIITCIDGICASRIVFRIVSGEVDFGSIEVRIVVYRVIESDTLAICASCSVRGNGPGGYSFAIPGASDGREIPDYNVRIVSLPQNGTLYNSDSPVSLGDIISVRNVDLSYEPNSGYFNRYLYMTSPEITLSTTDDFGNTAPETDFFVVEILSSFDGFALTPVEGQIYLLVSTRDGSRLTACPVNASAGNFWEASCVAVGMESNTVFGEYATPVYLDYDGTSDSVGFIITRLPAHGILYKNDGTYLEPVFGPRVRLMETLNNASILYVGHTDYNNQRDSSFVNILGEPLGGCSQVNELGCPDTFAFKVITIDTNRTSPTVTYSVYIVALSSESTIVALQESVMVPGGGTVVAPFQYTEPDNGEAYVIVEIVSYDAFFGSSVSGLPDCFATLNCSEQVTVYLIDKYAKELVENIIVVVDANSTLEEERTVFVSVVKRPEEGFIYTDNYIPANGDLVFAADVIVYADPDDDDPYYFDSCEQDDCEEYYASQNAIAFAQQIMNYIALATGLVAPLLALISVLAVWWMFCSKGKEVMDFVNKVTPSSSKHRRHSRSRPNNVNGENDPLVKPDKGARQGNSVAQGDGFF